MDSKFYFNVTNIKIINLILSIPFFIFRLPNLVCTLYLDHISFRTNLMLSAQQPYVASGYHIR